jgi:hypothetical protein
MNRREPLTICIKNACHTHVNVILAVEAVRQRLSNSLAFIVTSARSDGVDMTPAGYQSYELLISQRPTVPTNPLVEGEPPGHHKPLLTRDLVSIGDKGWPRTRCTCDQETSLGSLS